MAHPGLRATGHIATFQVFDFDHALGQVLSKQGTKLGYFATETVTWISDVPVIRTIVPVT